MPTREEIARRALAAAEVVAVGRVFAGGQSGSDGRVDGCGDGCGDGVRTRGAPHSAPRKPGPVPHQDVVPEDPSTVDAEPDPHDVARQIVLRQLTMAPRSRAQLEDKLRRRGCAPEVARAVLDRMQEVGLVDDEAYAGMVVRSQRVGRGLARRALQAELRKKGVADDIAADALQEVSDDDERDEARRLVEKKLRTMQSLPAQTQARRLAGMLARKGYSGELAYSVIREAIRAAPEHRRD